MFPEIEADMVEYLKKLLDNDGIVDEDVWVKIVPWPNSTLYRYQLQVHALGLYAIGPHTSYNRTIGLVKDLYEKLKFQKPAWEIMIERHGRDMDWSEEKEAEFKGLLKEIEYE